MCCRRLGFTLIELLVVIAIIAILAAILFPVFAGAKKRAQMMSCITNQKQLISALQSYRNDNNGFMPFSSSQANPGRPNWCGIGRFTYPGSTNPIYWCEPLHPVQGQLRSYVRNADIFFCQVDRGTKPMNYITEVPTGKKPWDFPLSYSMNTYISLQNPDTLSIKRQSKFALIMHENRYNINDGVFHPSDNANYNTRDIPAERHYDGTVVGYLDGHARWASQEKLLQECKDYWIPLQ